MIVVGATAACLVKAPPREPSSAPLAPMPRWDPDRLDGLGDDYFHTARWTDADDAVARHPAGRARVADTGRARAQGPGRRPEFLRALDRAIHGNSQAGEEV